MELGKEKHWKACVKRINSPTALDNCLCDSSRQKQDFCSEITCRLKVRRFHSWRLLPSGHHLSTLFHPFDRIPFGLNYFPFSMTLYFSWFQLGSSPWGVYTRGISPLTEIANKSQRQYESSACCSASINKLMCPVKEVLLCWFFKLHLWFLPFLRNPITHSYFPTADVRQYLEPLLFFIIIFTYSIKYLGEFSAPESLKLFSDIFVAYA